MCLKTYLFSYLLLYYRFRWFLQSLGLTHIKYVLPSGKKQMRCKKGPLIWQSTLMSDSSSVIAFLTLYLNSASKFVTRFLVLNKCQNLSVKSNLTFLTTSIFKALYFLRSCPTPMFITYQITFKILSTAFASNGSLIGWKICSTFLKNIFFGRSTSALNLLIKKWT